MIGMCVERDLVQFELIMASNPIDTVEKIKSQEGMSCGTKEKPHLARTLDGVPTVFTISKGNEHPRPKRA